MWKGLGKKLKDLADDLTTPPFEIEEDDEEQQEGALAEGARAKTRSPHEDDGQKHVHHEEAANEYMEAEGGILIPRSSLKRESHHTAVGPGSRSAEFPTPPSLAGSSSPTAGQQGQPAGNTAGGYAQQQPLDEGSMSHEVDKYFSRRLEDELISATPTTNLRGVPPKAMAQTATLTSSPATISPPAAVAETEASAQGTVALDSTQAHTAASAAVATGDTSSSSAPHLASGHAPSPSPVPKEKDLVDSLQQRVQALQAEKAQLNADVLQYQEQVKRSHEELVAYYENQLAALRGALTQKDEELAALHTRLAEAESAEETQLSGQLEDLQARYARVVDELEQQQSTAAEQNRLFEDERNQAAARQEAAASAERALQARVDELAQRVEELQQVAATATAEADAARAAQHSQQTTEERSGPGVDSDTLVAGKNAEILQLTEERDVADAARAQAEHRLSELSQECGRLQEDLEIQRDLHRRQEARLASREADIAEPQEELKAHMAEHAAKTAALESTLASKDAELEQLRHQLDATNESLARANEEALRVARDSEGRAAEWQQLQKSVEDATQRCADESAAHQRDLEAQQERHDASLLSLQQEWEEKVQTAARVAREEASAAAAASCTADATGQLAEAHALQISADGQRLEAEKRCAAVMAEKSALEEAMKGFAARLEAVTADLEAARVAGTETEAEVQSSKAERALLAKELEATKTELRALQAERKADRDRLDNGDASMASLTSRVHELVQEREQTNGALQDLQRAVVDSLTRNNSGSAGGSGADAQAGLDLFNQRDSARFTFSDWVLTLTGALEKTASVARKAGRVEKEWQRTYEEARKVNESLNQQVADAWRTIGELQEELSVRDDTAQKLHARVRQGDERVAAMQEQLLTVTNELASLREEQESGGFGQPVKDAAAHGTANGSRSPSRGTAAGGGDVGEYASVEDELLALRAEVQALQVALQDREEELSIATRSVENLEGVLASFKTSRSDDLSSRTLDLQLEIDQLKAELRDSEDARSSTQRGLDAAKEACERELVSKNVELTALHRKLAELRRALEDAARQLNGETMIDKRVVSHILVNFIHGFVEQKKETDEMLKILSGLLDWDDEMQERVGLLPGPLNPQPSGQGDAAGGKRSGLLSWVVRAGTGRTPAKVARPAATTEPAREPADHDSKKSSLAAMWVDFLMQESEKVAGPAQRDPAPAPAPPADGPPAPSLDAEATPAAAAAAAASQQSENPVGAATTAADPVAAPAASPANST